MNQQFRRPLATLSIFGVSCLRRQNPCIVAWWSAAFPGFGQYLLGQYLRATLLTLCEVITNTLSHINEAIVYSFCGQFQMAMSVLQPRWAYGYLVIFLYAIWESYRSAVVQNKMCALAEFENERLPAIHLHPQEIQYLEQKNPYIAAFYSFVFPGLGQLYNHRFALAFYTMFWWWFYITFSHGYESLFYLLLGDIQRSIRILRPHWLLFMPSVTGGAVHHAFITAVDHNRLYRAEQRQHLRERYQNAEVRIFS